MNLRLMKVVLMLESAKQKRVWNRQICLRQRTRRALSLKSFQTAKESLISSLKAKLFEGDGHHSDGWVVSLFLFKLHSVGGLLGKLVLNRYDHYKVFYPLRKASQDLICE